MVEYALLVALLAVIAVGALRYFGGKSGRHLLRCGRNALQSSYQEVRGWSGRPLGMALRRMNAIHLTGARLR